MRTLLIVSQVYVPDPAAVGQHLHDLASAMVQRGVRVRVVTSAAGYADPTRHYPRSEVRDGVQIARLPLSSFGKSTLLTRLAGGSAFLAQAALAGALTRELDAVLVSTSPPMAGVLGEALSRIKRVPMIYWVMDINPDQVVASGRLPPDALAVHAFERMNRHILGAAARIVTLDDYMRDRLLQKGTVPARVTVLPPWQPVEAGQAPLSHADNPFRREYGLEDKLVVMYSGNCSPVHPVDTVLAAAERLQQDPRLLLLFIGGGNGLPAVKQFVEQRRLSNVRFLPYQPHARLRESLSAADVHLVSMGDAMVGIVHPSKIYGAVAVGRPVLFLGPERCHISDVLRADECGLRVDHGDVDAAEGALRRFLAMSPAELAAYGQRSLQAARKHDAHALQTRMCELIEAAATG